MSKLAITTSILVTLLTVGAATASAQCLLPNPLSNGDVADGAKVAADFSALANCADDQAPAGLPNAIQYNAGSGSIAGVPPLDNGQTLIGSTGNPPQAGTITAGSGIAITNGPASITVTATGSGTGSSVDWLSKSAVVKPDASTFTLQTSTTAPGGAAIGSTTRGMVLTGTPVTDGRSMMAEVTVPAGNWQLTMLAVYTGPLSLFVAPGIAIRDPATSRAVWFTVGGGSNNGIRFDYIRTTGGAGLNSYSSDVQLLDAGFSTPTEPSWSRLTRNGSNLIYSFSRDGQNFTPAYTVSTTDFLTNLSRIGPAIVLFQPTHPAWNFGYHVLSWNFVSI